MPVDRLVDHLRSAIGAAPLVTEPFDHVVLDGFLPAVEFADLLGSLPATDRYERPEAPDAARRPGERLLLGRDSPRVPRDLRVSLDRLDAALASPAVGSAWFDALRITAREPLGRDVRSQSLLARDLPPYAIGPHTDVPRRVMSGILYLGPRGAPPSWGTTFFVPAEPGFACDTGRHYGFERFVATLTVDFVPNRACVFRRSHRSFHGLLPMTGGPGPRNVLLFELFRAQASPAP